MQPCIIRYAEGNGAVYIQVGAAERCYLDR